MKKEIMSKSKRVVCVIDGIEQQKCCRCNKFKPLDGFSISRWAPHTVCKECKKAYDKIYREKTKALRAQKNKKYRELHYEELKEKTREKYRNNSQKYIDRSNEYRRRKVKENWFAREWFHEQARKYVKRHNILFTYCQLCGKDGTIELHHPSYEAREKRSYVVPLCRTCHRYVEQKPEECPAPINLLNYK